MTDPAFFGYGSLVNLATHGYANPRIATLPGWRRVWQRATTREVAFLSVAPDPDSAIDGIVADVPGGDWTALDTREHAYTRVDVTTAVGTGTPTAVYRVPDQLIAKGGTKPVILLSYLDVVVQGYMQIYGPAGADHFFATTHGWDAPVLNDRDAPRYPRHQRLAESQRFAIDAHLRRRDVTLISG
jgi:hypothetical protein